MRGFGGSLASYLTYAAAVASGRRTDLEPSVCVAPVPDPEYDNETLVVVELEEDAVLAAVDAIAVGSSSQRRHILGWPALVQRGPEPFDGLLDLATDLRREIE